MRPVPSLARRAFVALAVLVAFHLTVIVIALALLPIPVVVFMKMQRVQPMALIAVAACCWVPALLLFSGLLGVKPPRFDEPGLPLRREDAPALFAMIDELAAAAGIIAPDDVYLSATPEAFVAETGGGFFGLRSRRILCIGAPLLATATVGEVRALLAHELGHYLGGDTRLGGILAYTVGAFRSVLEATERNAFHETSHWTIELAHSFAGGVAKALVRFYSWIYLRLTRPMSRRQELAADALSAELAGRENAVRALEHAHLLDPLYQLYLRSEVALVIEAGAMPTDLLAGFERFRARFAERGDVAELERAVRETKTDPFDTHPALTERVAALRSMNDTASHVVDASARTLLDGPFDVDAWLVGATLTSFERSPLAKPVTHLTWSEITRTLVPSRIQRVSRELAALLFARLPHATTMTTMLAGVLAELEAGRIFEFVATVEPQINEAPPHVAREAVNTIASRALAAIAEGALLEQGAEIEESLGEPCMVFRFGGKTWRPGLLAHDSMEDAAARRELGHLAAVLSGGGAVPFSDSQSLPSHSMR